MNDQSIAVDIIYLEFQIAFDIVLHKKFIKKIKEGTKGEMGK